MVVVLGRFLDAPLRCLLLLVGLGRLAQGAGEPVEMVNGVCLDHEVGRIHVEVRDMSHELQDPVGEAVGVHAVLLEPGEVLTVDGLPALGRRVF